MDRPPFRPSKGRVDRTVPDPELQPAQINSTQPTSQISSVSDSMQHGQHQGQQRVCHFIPNRQHPSQANRKKVLIANVEETHIHVQRQQPRNQLMTPVPPATQQNFDIDRQMQLAVQERLLLSSGEGRSMQLVADQTAIEQRANARRQQPNTSDAADIPFPMMQRAQNGPRLQASTEYRSVRRSPGPDRAEEAIRNVIEMNSFQYGTGTSNFDAQHSVEMSPNLAIIALPVAERGAGPGQLVAGQLRPRRDQALGQSIEHYPSTAAQVQPRQRGPRVALLNRRFTQIPGLRDASQDTEQTLPSSDPNTNYGNQLNKFSAQQSSDAPVQIPPSLIVTQETRSATGRFRRTSLEAAGASRRYKQRSLPCYPAATQDAESSLYSQPHTNHSMGLPVTPTAKRDQPGASGSNIQTRSSLILEPQVPSDLINMGTGKIGSDSQVGYSQNPRPQAPSSLANTLHSLPVLSVMADTNINHLRHLQNANQQPDGVLIMPGEYTPIPTPLPYAVSSSPTQVEQGSRTMLQCQSLPEFKTRVTIAISGCPASGKSTLAYLLAAVFEGSTIRDTGFAGAQTLYPVFNGRVEENPTRKGPITKVIVIHQNSYTKPVAECPVAEWTELYPYSPAMEVMNPQIGTARAFADERGNRSYERYWEAAYKANIGVDPSLVSNSSSSRFPRLVPPTPIRMSKKGPNLDCRGAVAWTKFGKAINDGIGGHQNKGILATEAGRGKIAAYLGQPQPNSSIPLVTSRKLEPLRERIREWIREETAQNDRIGFAGRSVVEGGLREMLILDGSLLFLQTHPNKGAGGEKLMKVCDVKLFLPTLETEAIQRRFTQTQYMDPPKGARKSGETWMFEGYFSEVAWKEYKAEHAWLFESGNAANRLIKTSAAAYHHGIHVRDFYTSNLEEDGHKFEGKSWADETLDWAVQTILFQLSVEEGFGRQAFFMKQMSEAAGRGDIAAEGAGQEGTSGV